MNNTPLFRFIKRVMRDYDQLYRRLTVSTLNIETGLVEFFNNDNLEYNKWHHAVFASTCIPGLFPPHEWTLNGEVHRNSDNFMLGNANP